MAKKRNGRKGGSRASAPTPSAAPPPPQEAATAIADRPTNGNGHHHTEQRSPDAKALSPTASASDELTSSRRTSIDTNTDATSVASVLMSQAKPNPLSLPKAPVASASLSPVNVTLATGAAKPAVVSTLAPAELMPEYMRRGSHGSIVAGCGDVATAAEAEVEPAEASESASSVPPSPPMEAKDGAGDSEGYKTQDEHEERLPDAIQEQPEEEEDGGGETTPTRQTPPGERFDSKYSAVEKSDDLRSSNEKLTFGGIEKTDEEIEPYILAAQAQQAARAEEESIDRQQRAQFESTLANMDSTMVMGAIIEEAADVVFNTTGVSGTRDNMDADADMVCADPKRVDSTTEKQQAVSAPNTNTASKSDSFTWAMTRRLIHMSSPAVSTALRYAQPLMSALNRHPRIRAAAKVAGLISISPLVGVMLMFTWPLVLAYRVSPSTFRKRLRDWIVAIKKEFEKGINMKIGPAVEEPMNEEVPMVGAIAAAFAA
ncbi:hypothetical protein HK101_005978 [Irineochytrium annulatum]|nr:hypothetical protein HK101_005978 [Irineochytrium annulatum]